VAVLTQLSINADEKLFSTGYRDPPYTNTAYDAKSDDEDDAKSDGSNDDSS
jgi:hypothetical protein